MGDECRLFLPVVMTRQKQRLSDFVRDHCAVQEIPKSEMHVLSQKPFKTLEKISQSEKFVIGSTRHS